MFIAPVNGVYFFSFSGHNRSSKPMGLRLFKTGQQMITVYNHPLGYRYDTGFNSISLTLDKGDQVCMRLRENTWVFDNANDHTSFSHLLFSLWWSCMYYYLHLLWCIFNVNTFDHFKYTQNVLYIPLHRIWHLIFSICFRNKRNCHIRFWNVMLCGWVICV